MRKLTPEEEARMSDGTKLLLGAIALGVLLTLFIAAIQNRVAVELWWQANVVPYEVIRL